MRRPTIAAIAAISAIAFTQIASAADLPRKAPAYTPPPPPPVINWTGFYIGGDVGWAGSRQDGTVTALPAPGFGAPGISGAGIAGFGLLPTAYNLDRNGVLGGIYAGYNWQVGQIVFGVEGEFNFLHNKASDTQALFDTFGPTPVVDGSTVELTAKNQWLASIRGRVGYAWDKLMIYATGGAAFTRTEYNMNLNGAGFPGTPSSSIGFTQDKVGYAVGAGAEWMFAQSWIVRLEYMHYGFDGSTGALPVVVTTCTVALNCRLVANTSDLNIDSVRVGLTYKFGGPY